MFTRDDYYRNCLRLVADYCYGAHFNRNPDKTECSNYEPAHDKPVSYVAIERRENFIDAKGD